MRGPGPPVIHTKTWSPHRRPAHQNAQSNIISDGIPRKTANRIDVSPTRARAPMLMIEAVEPRMNSSSAGWEETSAGISGSSANCISPLAMNAPMMIRSSRSARPTQGFRPLESPGAMQQR